MLKTARINTGFTTEELYEQLLFLPHLRPKDSVQAKKLSNEELAMIYHNQRTPPSRKKWAREKLILDNDRLVWAMAHQYSSKKYPLEDLHAHGIVGLIESIDRYDPSRGVPFHIYARYWIKKHMEQFKSTFRRPIKVPAHLEVQVNRILRAREKFEQQHHRSPTIREIKEFDPLIKLKPKQIKDLIEGTGSVRLEDLRAKGWEPEGTSVDHDQREFINHLSKAVSILDDRSRMIVELRHGLGKFNGKGEKNFNQIAGVTNLSAERVRQLYHSAMLKMRLHYKRSFMLGKREFLLASKTAGLLSAITDIYKWIVNKFRPKPGSWNDPRFKADAKKLQAARGLIETAVVPIVSCHNEKTIAGCKNVTTVSVRVIVKRFRTILGYRLHKDVSRNLPNSILLTLNDYDESEFGSLKVGDIADVVIYMLEMGILQHHNLLQ